jgi:hypothetical protein
VSNDFHFDAFDDHPLNIARPMPTLPAWLARRLLGADEKVAWVWGPSFNPDWERYLTHPALVLLALVLAAILWLPLTALEPLVLIPPVLVAGAIVFGTILVLAFANAYFTRLIVTNTRLLIVQGHAVCSNWSIHDLPPSLIRYSRLGTGEETRTVDLEALHSMLGGSSDQFAPRDAILAFGKKLQNIKAQDNRKP